jgi:hypothetical protein
MFEGFPLLHGNYFTYGQFFPLLIATTSLITAALVLVTHAAVVAGLQWGASTDYRGRRTPGALLSRPSKREPSAAVPVLEISPLSKVKFSDDESSPHAAAAFLPDNALVPTLGRQNICWEMYMHWAVGLIGLGLVFGLWFVWTLMAFGSSGWAVFILGLTALLLLLAVWPMLAARCGLATWAAEGVATRYYVVLLHLLPWFAAAAGSFGLLQPSIWGLTSLPVGTVLGAIPLLLWVTCSRCCFLPHPSGSRSLASRRWTSRRRPAVLIVACLGWSGFWAAALDGMCIAFFQPDAPGIHLGHVLISTRFSRSWSTPPCTVEQPGACHVYLTVAEDLSTQVYVNAHTQAGSATNLRVCYWHTKAQPEATRECVVMDLFSMARDVEPGGRRDIHSALLGGLWPGTAYWFRLVDGEEEQVWSSERSFRTTGAQAAGVRFAVGGESGSTTNSRRVMRAVAARDTAFVVHGGDIAYGNNLPGCYPCWDSFLSDWETSMVAPNGAMIPLLSVVGNHDAGSNHNARVLDPAVGAVSDDDPTVLQMLRLFPHEVPAHPPAPRHTYHRHTAAAGALSIIVLDSPRTPFRKC